MYSPAQAKTVCQAIKIFHPEILEKIKPKLVKPEPVLFHTILLPALLKRFCELKEITQASIVGIRYNAEAVEAKTLFVACIVTLFHPDLLPGIHAQALKPHLAEELSGLLETDRTWVSQTVSKIKSILNPHKSLPAHEDFKNQSNRIARVLAIEFSK